MPIDKCVWERLADKTIGLAAWAQRCDFGFRQIHFSDDNAQWSSATEILMPEDSLL
ncbi:hypothetical protein [Mesorhizobium opportunistum]|uniref:hypothetical protein n=1 Tax=Mesorhizobium opportunistum TaxID=593909 RepID=UPI0002DEA21E|nr:hypothetical protein [Mesorhizobium opportunistum]